MRIAVVGEVLDDAVHQVGRNAVPLGLPLFAADALANLAQSGSSGSPLRLVGDLAVASLLVNRARVVAILTARAPGRRTAWRGVLGRLDTLPYAVVFLLDYAPAAFIVVAAVAIVQFVRLAQLNVMTPGVVHLPPWAIAIGVAAIAGVVPSILLPFALMLGLAETVVERVSPWRAAGMWLRFVFRRDAFGAMLFAAFAFDLLVLGVSLLAETVPYHETAVGHVMLALPEGLGDALAVVFALRWREVVLDRRRGLDLDALLDAAVLSRDSSPARANAPGAC